MSPGGSMGSKNQRPNLILTGFMGTGKTTVGREVARRLGWPFLDMDAEIEVRAGKSIPRLFAEEGEAAFREMESALCRELSRRSGWVIATGGGALIDPDNREVMRASGTVVCLTCDVEGILERLRRKPQGRPLLAVDDPRAEIERLLAARQEAYAAIPWQIDTTGLSVAQIAERVLALAQMMTLPVRHPSGQYAIHIGEGLLDQVGGALRMAGLAPGSRAALVVPAPLAPLYGERVRASLERAGYEPFLCPIPDGEEHKTLDTVAALYDRFLDGRLDRSGLMVSVGGGVSGDIAGFAAASFMRGLPFVQVPTTLLAMTDASVGGKTGVDLPQGKNLVGAFKQPEVVVIDPEVLATLPQAEIRAGMAEVLKHGLLADPQLFAELETPPQEGRLPLSVAQLARSLRVKIEIVESDPYERGRRAVLNLGHTVGHGLERLSGFSLRHGEAVAIGLVAAARIAVRLGLAAPVLVSRIEAALTAWGLPVRCPPYDVAAIWEAMGHDKKRRGRSLRWVLPYDVGQVEIVPDVPPEVVRSVLCEMGARESK